jgi:hypothetical protein
VATRSGCVARTCSTTRYAGVDGVVESALLRDRCELGSAQVSARGDREQEPALGGWEPGHADAERLLDRVRHRQLLAGRGRSLLSQGAPDFERERRVEEGGLDEPTQLVPASCSSILI